MDKNLSLPPHFFTFSCAASHGDVEIILFKNGDFPKVHIMRIWLLTDYLRHSFQRQTKPQRNTLVLTRP